MRPKYKCVISSYAFKHRQHVKSESFAVILAIHERAIDNKQISTHACLACTFFLFLIDAE